MSRRDGGRAVEPVDDQLAAMTYDELVATGTVLYERLQRCRPWVYSGLVAALLGAAAFAIWCWTDRYWPWVPILLASTVWSWAVPSWAARRSRTLSRAHTAVYSECLRRLALLRQRHRDEIDLIRRQLDARMARLRGEVHPADEWIREWEGRLR